MGGAYKSLRYRALCLMYRGKFELYQPSPKKKSHPSACFCNGLCHGSVSMATRPGLRLGSAGLSGENLRSFCLAGSDDNGAEPRPELCRRDPAADGRRAPPSATA